MIDVTEICKAVRNGEDITEAVAKLEPKIKRFCEARDGVRKDKPMSRFFCFSEYYIAAETFHAFSRRAETAKRK